MLTFLRLREKEHYLLESVNSWKDEYTAGTLMQMFRRQHERNLATLAKVQARIAALMPPVEVEDGKLLLRRESYFSPCNMCPFCGYSHSFGLGDGPRASHCSFSLKDLEITAPNGQILKSGQNCVVRTTPFNKEHVDIVNWLLNDNVPLPLNLLATLAQLTHAQTLNAAGHLVYTRKATHVNFVFRKS